MAHTGPLSSPLIGRVMPGASADRTMWRRAVPVITIKSSIHQLRSVCAARTCSSVQSSARVSAFVDTDLLHVVRTLERLD